LVSIPAGAPAMVVGEPKVPVAVSKTKVRSEFGVRPVLT